MRVCHEEACAGHCSSTTHLPQHTAHEVTLEVVLQTPLDDPRSPDEQVACTHLGQAHVARSVAESGGTVLFYRQRMNTRAAGTDFVLNSLSIWVRLDCLNLH